MLLLKFEEQGVADFLIPAFTLSEGEILIIHIPNGPFFSDALFPLVDILTGETSNKRIEVYSRLKYAIHPKESWFRAHFNPTTVGEYLEKNAGSKKNIAKCIYGFEGVVPTRTIQTLTGNPRKYLSIATTFSNTQNIVFDLAGVDPLGGIEIYNFVKRTVHQEGGAAILIDGHFEFRNDCTKFIEAEYRGTLTFNL